LLRAADKVSLGSAVGSWKGAGAFVGLSGKMRWTSGQVSALAGDPAPPPPPFPPAPPLAKAKFSCEQIDYPGVFVFPPAA